MELSAGIVVGRKTEKNMDGNVPVRILQVMITDMNDVQSVQLLGQAGEECNPPDGSLVLVNATGEAFKLTAGTADTIEPVLAVGGKRIYSTNIENDTVMAQVRLDPDGKITVSNDIASMTMLPTGEIMIGNTNTFMKLLPGGIVEIKTTQLNIDGYIKTNNHIEVGSGQSTSVNAGGKSLIFKNGILVGVK